MWRYILFWTKEMQKRIIWLQKSDPHKQDNPRELSIQTEISKNGLDCLKNVLDSVTHKWIQIITFQKYTMKKLGTNHKLINRKGKLETKNFYLNINNEIFQGNSLSSFLFYSSNVSHKNIKIETMDIKVRIKKK